MDFSKYEEKIKSTGFPLEFSISETLRKEGWGTINNRYYIDDQKEDVREIDIIAYKANKVKEFYVYTAVIISCKKNKDNLWALLSKNINKRDVNTDWKPIHIWTSHEMLEVITSEEGFKDRYYSYIAEQGVKQALTVPETHIFAFQEMNKQSGAVQNDKPIFQSVTSLMKAQAYELTSLSKKDRPNCVYQFNLVSIVDSELIKLHFEEDSIQGSQIDQANYVGRYIINKEETFAHIHFIKASAFDEIVKDYNALHIANCCFFNDEYDRFFLDVVKDFKKYRLFRDEFSAQVREALFYESCPCSQIVNLEWFESNKTLYVEIGDDLSDEMLSSLNANQKLIKKVKKVLETVYRYKGKFKFSRYIYP